MYIHTDVHSFKKCQFPNMYDLQNINIFKYAWEHVPCVESDRTAMSCQNILYHLFCLRGLGEMILYSLYIYIYIYIYNMCA